MKILKRVFYSLLIVIALFSIAVAFLMPSLKVATGYAAKYYCSSKFLAGQEHDVILKNLDFFPVNISKFIIDPERRTIEAKIPLIVSRKAFYYEGERDCGCVLDSSISESLESSNSFSIEDRPDNIVSDSIPDGVDIKAIEVFVDSCIRNNQSILNVSLVYKNQYILEKYQNGIDKNTRILGWSMTKSVTNAIFGVMQKKGMINIQNETGIEEWNNDPRARITLNHLLQMNSGLQWEENYKKVSDVTTMLYLRDDFGKYATDKSQNAGPGINWMYSSGTTNILSRYARKLFPTEADYNSFVYDSVLNKIGMKSALIERNNAGYHVLSSYCWATARDWTQFGLLYLNKGHNGTEQVLDSSWVDYSISPAPNSEDNYGAHLWLNKGGKFPSLPDDAFYESGYGGQKVMVIPSMDLIIVLLSGRQKEFDLNNFYKNIISNFNENK